MSAITYTSKRKLTAAHTPVELIIDGDMSSAAAWTVTNGWVIAGGLATKTPGAINTIGQFPALTPTWFYDVAYTISGRTAGNVDAWVLGNVGTTISTNGSVVETIQAGPSDWPNFKIQANATFDGSIDDVSVMLAAEQSYSLDFRCLGLNPSMDIKRKDHDPLEGPGQSRLLRINNVWKVSTQHLPASELEQWEEYFHSVAAREAHTFDPYGSVAVPDAPRSVQMVTKKPRRRRYKKTDRFSFSFTLREIT